MLFLVVLDSSSSAPRMHFAPTTPQASVVTAGLASMETDGTVYPRVRVAPLNHRDTFHLFLFLNLFVKTYISILLLK